MRKIILTPAQAAELKVLLTPTIMNAKKLRAFGYRIGAILELLERTGEIDLRRLAQQRELRDFIRENRKAFKSARKVKRVETISDLNAMAGRTLTNNRLTNEDNISIIVDVVNLGWLVSLLSQGHLKVA